VNLRFSDDLRSLFEQQPQQIDRLRRQMDDAFALRKLTPVDVEAEPAEMETHGGVIGIIPVNRGTGERHDAFPYIPRVFTHQALVCAWLLRQRVGRNALGGESG